MMLNPHISGITLGVKDLKKARSFYQDLGLPIQRDQDEWVSFSLDNGASALGLFAWDSLAGDAGVDAGGSGFRGVTFSYIVGSEERVDELLSEAESAGGAIAKPAQQAEWGGYYGYFTHPDGYLGRSPRATERSRTQPKRAGEPANTTLRGATNHRDPQVGSPHHRTP